MKEPEKATKKAKVLVRMAVSKAILIEPLPQITLDVIQKTLIIGGGVAGMTSALAIADQGYDVFLIEKQSELGGNARSIYWTVENDDVQKYLKALVNKIEIHPHIKVYKKAHVENVEGYVGNYKTTIKNGNASLEIEHGAVIVTTGAEESKPKEYLYGKDKRVITQLDLEKQIASGKDFDKKTVVMIQCVGSRDDEHPYCSRICCVDAIKNALKLKKENPDVEIYVLYRDVRTYGFAETFYEKAREKGIIFIRYDVDEKPKVKAGQKDLEIVVRDRILDEKFLIHTDLLILSPAIIPREDNENVAKQLKVPPNENGFFLEAHVKLRPVDFATEGIFLAGMAHSPKSISESITQANGAAARALTIISKNKYTTEATIANVDEDLCSGCGICVTTCPYGAIEIKTEMVDGEEKKVSHVLEGVCKGCGACAGACPSGAIGQKGFKRIQISSMVDAAMAL